MKTVLDELKEELRTDGVEPNWIEKDDAGRQAGEPVHSDSCPQFDGKRCKLHGFKPDDLCQPAVVIMARALSVIPMPMPAKAPAPQPTSAPRE